MPFPCRIIAVPPVPIRYHKIRRRPSRYEVWSDLPGGARYLGNVWFSCGFWFNNHDGELYATRREAARGLTR